MFRRLIVLTFIVILPLIPSVLLYHLFGDSSFASFMSTGIHLGGPIAAYFIIFLAVIKLFKVIQPDEINKIIEKEKRNKKIMEIISGNWDFDANFQDENGAPKMVQGTASLNPDSIDGKLNITGNWKDESGNPIGNWDADEIILTDHDLIYHYSVPAIGDKPSSTGVSKLIFNYDDKRKKILSMNGNWGVLGRDYNGTMTWKRKSKK